MSTEMAEQARECERLADDESEQRVQHLCEAAEHWHSAGADDRARELFERALLDEGHAVGDERVAFVRFLLATGDTERAHRLLDEVWHSRDLDGSAYNAAGEVYEVRLDDPASALRWYTSGIIRLAGPDATGAPENDVWIEVLIGARYRVRQQLGEPADEWDRMWEASRRSRSGGDAAREHEPQVAATAVQQPRGRNDPCWCGSGRKYKKCCGAPGSTPDD